MDFELDFELEHGVFKLELELELRRCVSANLLLLCSALSVCLSAAATTTSTAGKATAHGLRVWADLAKTNFTRERYCGLEVSAI